MAWSTDLVDQLDFYWNVHFRPRLAGLSDEEYLWEPVPGMWSVRPDAAGRVRVDFLAPEPPIPPVTTIAWRLDHVTREVLGKRARALFGGSPQGTPRTSTCTTTGTGPNRFPAPRRTR